MEEYDRCIKKLIEAFASSGLDYALTGAVAVSYYGSPRTTTDVDIMVAAVDKAEVKNKVTYALGAAGFQVDERKIDNAFTSGYNIATFKSRESPYTVDLIFSKENLEKQVALIAGVKTFLQLPESLILSKLRMIKATVPRERAQKDEEDVRAILAFTNVNIESVKKRAEKEKTLEILESLIV